ncbi:MAG: thiolase domain-containing protein [Candidatus Freyarchaeota archaeon]|nr:thiolase domain-containing protein [Candidatus Jordarchaeia archaeon]MBS7267279.1 thiolase domain-containing protein [Candidatus Jordarchaeia archaeon]MBS7280026.1 thiolase domain-containing protein [Candidatus Jordarchaeia archaeon]
MRDVYVIGVGMTKFGNFPIKPGVKEMGEEACFKAMKDANVYPKDIEAGYCGVVAGAGGAQGPLAGNLAMKQVGVVGVPITRCENGCASSSTAFREAWISVAAGLYDVVLVLGIEKMTGLPTREMLKAMTQGSDLEIEGFMGMTFPGVFGMIANRHMKEYGTTREQMAMVSVKNHHNATMNPHAHYPKEVSLEKVLKSPMIAYPLGLLDCCPISDGAAAAVIASRDVAKKFTDTPIKILAAVQKSGTFLEKLNATTFDITVRTAKEAYRMAKVEPKDIDLAEVHDCFTIAEILHNEDLGFFKKGEGGKAVEEGETQINAKVSINPSGGLLAKGHPVGATGVAQICELVWQLRGEAGARQVDGAQIGLAHCMGNFSHGDGGTCNVTILER